MTLETLLHAGADHPGLLWIIVPSLLSFAAGVALGVRGRPARWREDSPEAPPDH